jgi:hypothetical protein
MFEAKIIRICPVWGVLDVSGLKNKDFSQFGVMLDILGQKNDDV